MIVSISSDARQSWDCEAQVQRRTSVLMCALCTVVLVASSAFSLFCSLWRLATSSAVRVGIWACIVPCLESHFITWAWWLACAAGDAKPLKKPPAWLKRPVSVSFGFGGRLSSMANHKQQMQDPMTGQVGFGQSTCRLCGVCFTFSRTSLVTAGLLGLLHQLVALKYMLGLPEGAHACSRDVHTHCDCHVWVEDVVVLLRSMW